MAPRQQVRFLRLTEAERKTLANVRCRDPHAGSFKGTDEVLYAVQRGTFIFVDLGMRVPLGAGQEFDAMAICLDRRPRFEPFDDSFQECHHVCGSRNVAAVLTHAEITGFNGGTGYRSPAVT